MTTSIQIIGIITSVNNALLITSTIALTHDHVLLISFNILLELVVNEYHSTYKIVNTWCYHDQTAMNDEQTNKSLSIMIIEDLSERRGKGCPDRQHTNHPIEMSNMLAAHQLPPWHGFILSMIKNPTN